MSNKSVPQMSFLPAPLVSANLFHVVASGVDYKLDYATFISQIAADLPSSGGSISGLTTDRIPVADSATSLIDSYIYQELNKIKIDNGTTIESTDDNGQIDLGSGDYLKISHHSPSTNSEVNLDATTSAMNFNDGAAAGSVYIDSGKTVISHTDGTYVASVEVQDDTIVLHADNVAFDSLTASTLPYINSFGTFASLAASTDGKVLTLASGLPSWQTPTTGATYTGTTDRITISGGNAIDISATFEALLSKVSQRIDQNNAATTSAQIASVISDETGTGALVFANTPALVTPDIGAATGTSLVVSSKIDEAKGSDIASASTTNIGAANGNFVHITGTTTITAFDTIQAGVQRTLVFDGALTLTHNATSLILPGASNIVTGAGDTAIFRSEGSGNWRCISYTIASTASSFFKHVTSSVTETNSANKKIITELTLTNAAATSKYLIRGKMKIGCSSTGGVAIGVNAVAGSTLGITLFGTTSAVSTYNMSVLTVLNQLSGIGFTTFASQNGWVDIYGTIETGSTVGDIEIIFSPVTNTQTATINQLMTAIEYVKLT